MSSPRNVIPTRIAEALKQFPPFSMLAPEAVRALAAEATVSMVPEKETVWKQGERPANDVHFLARGRIEYWWNHDGHTERVDVRDVGDVLGLSAHMRGEAFRVTARASEDSLLYSLSWSALKPLIEQSDAARNYVRRHLFWVVRVGHAIDTEQPADEPVSGRAKNILQAHLDGAQFVQPRPLDRLVTCQASTTLWEAAKLMVDRKVSSVLVVDEARHPVGLVTSPLMVKATVVENVPHTTEVAAIMAKPVATISPRTSSTAAILIMLRERVNQVCITEDGTAASPALDICTHKDLLAQNGHHPAGLLRELRIARTPARFRELCDEIEAIARSYLEAGVSAIYVGQICAELYDELVQRLLILVVEEKAAEGVALPDVAWAWMSVGSDGRREQILRTDMDNAMVFASTGDAARDEQHRQVFLGFNERVIELLTGAGFARCQGGVMAQNPRWCRTETEWCEEIRNLRDSGVPDALLRATILFDLRYVAGDASLCARLRDEVFRSVSVDTRLQASLAAHVIDSTPPLNFIGRLVVEALGGRDEELDIKARGMAPLRDAARLFSLKFDLRRRHSTGGRWSELARVVALRADMANQARDAYDFLLRLRTLNGLRRGDSGRHLDPSTLNKLERSQLSSVFDVVRNVQQAVKVEFQVDLH